MFGTLKSRRPGSTIAKILFYECARVPAALAFIVLYRARVFGARRVPASGPLLLVANHQSFLDPPLIGFGVVQRQLDYLARVGLFNAPGLSWLISALNATPIRENSGDSAAIKEVLRRLEEGHAVLMFPEGSRTPDGSVAPFKRGIALLLRRAGCPVVPVAVEGAFDAWPRWRRLPRLAGRRVAVLFGAPIAPGELAGMDPDEALALLHGRVDAMRLRLRARLRGATHGRYPPPGPGDAPSTRITADAPALRSAPRSAGASRRAG